MSRYAAPVARPWPESVERVASFLRDAGVWARLEEFREATPTAEAAARAAGCELEQIVKSLVFHCDGRPVVVLVPGDRRADTKKVARVLGCDSLRVATANEVERATGFEPGAVSPIPLPGIERILIEQQLLTQDIVWIGAGSPKHLAAIAPGDLARLAHAREADVATAP